MNYLHMLYLGLLVLASGIGIYRFQILDTASRLFCLLVSVVFLSEVAALYAALVHKNNLGVYNTSIVLQSVLVCCYFNYSIDILSGRKIGLWVGIISLLCGVISLFSHDFHNSLNTWFIIYLGLLALSMSLLGLFRFLTADQALRISSHPHFWFLAIITMFWSFTLINWVAFTHYSSNFQSYATYATIFIIIVNILTYAAVGTVFLFYPKMINEQK